MKQTIGSVGKSVNDIGGKLYFRFFGTLTAIATIGAAYMAWSAFSVGELAGGFLVSAFAALMALFTRYCWSSKRRLTDIDP